MVVKIISMFATVVHLFPLVTWHYNLPNEMKLYNTCLPVYMLWFNFILGSNFFPLFQTHYHINITIAKNKGE